MSTDRKLSWDEMFVYVATETKGEGYLSKGANGEIFLHKHGFKFALELHPQDSADPSWLDNILEDWNDWPEDE